MRGIYTRTVLVGGACELERGRSPRIIANDIDRLLQLDRPKLPLYVQRHYTSPSTPMAVYEPARHFFLQLSHYLRTNSSLQRAAVVPKGMYGLWRLSFRLDRPNARGRPYII